MAVISMKQLLESGVHFGHQTRRWNPKMAKYIYTSRNDIYIIDLQKTLALIEENYVNFSEVAKTGKVLFVGTKKQASMAVKEAAERSGQFYINERWLGGTLTNFKTIRSRVERLKEIYRMREDGTFERLPKKEVVLLHKEMERLEKFLLGIKDMEELPVALFVVDPRKEEIAVKEARKLGIPVFAIVDTNCDPDEIDYVIPGNDDAIRAVRLIVNVMANAVIEANGGEVTEFLPEEEGTEDNRHHRKERRNDEERTTKSDVEVKKTTTKKINIEKTKEVVVETTKEVTE